PSVQSRTMAMLPMDPLGRAIAETNIQGDFTLNYWWLKLPTLDTYARLPASLTLIHQPKQSAFAFDGHYRYSSYRGVRTLHGLSDLRDRHGQQLPNVVRALNNRTFHEYEIFSTSSKDLERSMLFTFDGRLAGVIYDHVIAQLLMNLWGIRS